MKHITLEGGIKVGVFEKPPSDIDPFTASPAELRKYGLPPVPDHPRHRERYQRLFEQLRHKLTFVEPAFRVNPGPFPLPSREEPETTFASPTTSGTFVVAPPGDSIRWLQGDWVVPNVSAPSAEGQYSCAFWIGIGGKGGAAFQAGVHLSISGSNRQMFPFWEWLSPGEGHSVDITTFAVTPGDLISVILCTAQGAGSTDGTVYFFNRITGGHTSLAAWGPEVTALTAEWSVGFPYLWGGDASILADYGEVFFTECQAVTNAFTLIDGGNGNNVNLTTANGTVVSQSIPITDTIVQCLYVG